MIGTCFSVAAEDLFRFDAEIGIDVVPGFPLAGHGVSDIGPHIECRPFYRLLQGGLLVFGPDTPVMLGHPFHDVPDMRVILVGRMGMTVVRTRFNSVHAAILRIGQQA
ncbi:hypothetical protein ACWD5V_37240 [Streptomyces sp. NPDC002523]